MWSYIYIAGALKRLNTKWHFGTKSSGLIIKGGLEIKGHKTEGPHEYSIKTEEQSHTGSECLVRRLT